jgi:hypothetical protein
MTQLQVTVTNLSLFIPFVFSNISEQRIVHIFRKLLLGEVSYVDFVSKIDRYGKQYKSAYIHFSYWHQNIAAFNFQQRVIDPELEAKLVYDEPWHWIVFENTSEKVVVNGRKRCIDLGGVNAISRQPEPEQSESKKWYQLTTGEIQQLTAEELVNMLNELRVQDYYYIKWISLYQQYDPLYNNCMASLCASDFAGYNRLYQECILLYADILKAQALYEDSKNNQQVSNEFEEEEELFEQETEHKLTTIEAEVDEPFLAFVHDEIKYDEDLENLNDFYEEEEHASAVV